MLTGGDFDIESMRQAPDGTFWFGEEFGPFIVHADAKGRVLDAPVPLPRVFSPDNPFLFGRTPNLASSNGFEGMALSKDGRTLYPFLEGPLVGDDPLVRHVYDFDLSERRYTGRTWIYRMSIPGTLVSDAVAYSRDQRIVTERDNGQGPDAAWKKAFVIDVPGNRPNIAKREIIDPSSTSTTRRSLRIARSTPRLRPRQPVQVPVPDRRGRAPVLRQRLRVRQRHQFRVDRPEPESA